MNTNLMWQRFLKEGDNHSFSVIYNTHVDKLYSYGIHLGFQSETCKDAIQDIFYKLFLSRENLKHVNNCSAYLSKSFKNRLIDIIRKNPKTQNIDFVNESFSINITIQDKIIDAEKAALLKYRVEQLLQTLTAQQREAVYLRYMLELDYNEISEMLDINPESARKLMFRAMRKLREQTVESSSKAQFMFLLSLITSL